MFRSVFAFSRPAAARSLNDLSPRPPTSYARPTLRVCFEGADVVPAAGDVAPGEVVLEFPFLLLLHAASSSAMTATTAVIATPYLRRNANHLSRCPDPAGRIVHSRRSLKL